ncbi:hypothetical protein MEX01_23780 [Methylorubrum extorquens]|nr:hypothetical protein MEX01_23780 [Methylorubrum extorquens]
MPDRCHRKGDTLKARQALRPDIAFRAQLRSPAPRRGVTFSKCFREGQSVRCLAALRCPIDSVEYKHLRQCDGSGPERPHYPREVFEPR